MMKPKYTELLANFCISTCKKLLEEDILANLCHSARFLKFSGAKPLSIQDVSIRRSWFLVGKKLASFFCLWTKVHQINFACVEVIFVYSSIFWLTISCCILEICDQVMVFSQKSC